MYYDLLIHKLLNLKKPDFLKIIEISNKSFEVGNQVVDAVMSEQGKGR